MGSGATLTTSEDVEGCSRDSGSLISAYSWLSPISAEVVSFLSTRSNSTCVVITLHVCVQNEISKSYMGRILLLITPTDYIRHQRVYQYIHPPLILYVTTVCKPSIFRNFLSPWFFNMFEVIPDTLNKNYATEEDINEKENSNCNT